MEESKNKQDEEKLDNAKEPPAPSQQTNQSKPTIAKPPNHSQRSRPYHNMRIPILRPKLPPKPAGAAVRLITNPPPIEPSSSNPRPLISLLDQTEFKDRSKMFLAQNAGKPKKPYYTELNEIRKEFGIPESFDTSKPTTMSGVALSDKLQLLQRLRGENKFLRESIQKKTEVVDARSATIEQLQRSTADVLHYCDVLRGTLNSAQNETNRIRSQMR